MRNLRSPPFQRQAQRLQQRGIAALEFALLALFVIVPVFLGSFVFWEVLQTQQVVTRATGDGARQAFRQLQSARAARPDGTYPSDTQAFNTAAIQARITVMAALRGQLGDAVDVDRRLTVTLVPHENGMLALNVIYARPAMLGAAGGMNFIEPATLTARSLISRQ